MFNFGFFEENYTYYDIQKLTTKNLDISFYDRPGFEDEKNAVI